MRHLHTPTWLAWASAALLSACAESAGPVDPGTPLAEPWETPAVEDDLVPATPGGKFDTGYLSNLAAELEGAFSGEVAVDVRHLSEADRQARLETLRDGGWETRNLIDTQIKFAKNQINASQLHLNLSASDVELSEVRLDEQGFIRISYQTTVETLVNQDELSEAGTSLEQILRQSFTAVVPDDPSRMAEAVGNACLQTEGHGAAAYNYFYYYDPTLAGCAEAMSAANIGRVEARLSLRNLAPAETVFPEYDLLTADDRIDVVIFFGAADHAWEPGKWDWGVYARDGFVRDLTSRNFRRQPLEQGELYTRRVGDLTENVTVIGPEVLKLLRDDTAGLFTRLVQANEIVMYNGHSFYGSLSVLDQAELYPGRYQIFFMNSCWSYEYYTKQIFRHNATEADPDGWLLADVVNDTEEGWFHNMGPESRILLTNLLAGAETGGVDGQRYYTWDRIIGAMNQHAIDDQRTRGSKSHEIYGVSGVTTNRYNPIRTPDPNPTAQRYESAPALAIPDNSRTGTRDVIRVPAGRGTVGSVSIELTVEHPYVGDLTVTLRHGDRYLTLHNRAGGSTDNLALDTVSDHFAGLSAEGEWTLEVVDGAAFDEGRLVSWALEL